jgi:hypothetical protein
LNSDHWTLCLMASNCLFLIIGSHKTPSYLKTTLL